MTLADCEAVSGIWHGSTTCADVSCENRLVPCCLPDGTCELLLGEECDAEGGTSGPMGGNCGQVSCTGACCLSNGTCTDDQSPNECTAAGGELHLGELCANLDCSVGACCYVVCAHGGQDCEYTCSTAADEPTCAALTVEPGSYVWHGHGTACDDVECPVYVPPEGDGGDIEGAGDFL